MTYLKVRAYFQAHPSEGVFIAAAGIAIGLGLYLLAVEVWVR